MKHLIFILAGGLIASLAFAQGLGMQGMPVQPYPPQGGQLPGAVASPVTAPFGDPNNPSGFSQFDSPGIQPFATPSPTITVGVSDDTRGAATAQAGQMAGQMAGQLPVLQVAPQPVVCSCNCPPCDQAAGQAAGNRADGQQNTPSLDDALRVQRAQELEDKQAADEEERRLRAGTYGPEPLARN